MRRAQPRTMKCDRAVSLSKSYDGKPSAMTLGCASGRSDLRVARSAVSRARWQSYLETGAIDVGWRFARRILDAPGHAGTA
ncbi:hypothetical protein D7S89_14255 [Trinickia fusca]|uniref:Uncharacterized protein n=1 Tax=Trinickia fusca TaxID=2419777 RepID=A0A494X9M3_9BURK|nr:hypothetical protein D7S89_14255 [Trinickia fusca]